MTEDSPLMRKATVWRRGDVRVRGVPETSSTAALLRAIHVRTKTRQNISAAASSTHNMPPPKPHVCSSAEVGPCKAG